MQLPNQLRVTFMPFNTPWRHVWLTLSVLAAVLLLSELTSLDLWLQSRFYDSSAAAWLWRRDEPVLRFLLYDGIRVCYALFALALLLVGAGRKTCRDPAQPARSADRVAGGDPGAAVCKCPEGGHQRGVPRALETFGGDVPYVKLFDRYPPGRRPEQRQRCYPAGHASGGFALLSLYYLLGSVRARRRALWFALGAGWVAGIYKMVTGDHFISHTVVSMLLAWLLVNLVAVAVRRAVPAPEPAR